MSAVASMAPTSREQAGVQEMTATLDRDGIVVLPQLVDAERFQAMQQAFAGRLTRMAWNDTDGYVQNELHRQMVHDVLTLAQGFMDAALHPAVLEVARRYIGPRFALVEAKGWRTLATHYDFQGWHGDQWYDPAQVRGIPRELKMGVYLTDVASGAFKYLRGSQGQREPRGFRPDELGEVSPRQVLELAAPAGTSFLFDTSGVHRQSVPVLEPRQAVFFVYRDPTVPLRSEEVQYQRYRPLMLNAAYLAGLSAEEQRVLGFGDKTHCVEGPGRVGEHAAFQSLARSLFRSKLWLTHHGNRVWGRLKRLIRPGQVR